MSLQGSGTVAGDEVIAALPETNKKVLADLNNNSEAELENTSSHVLIFSLLTHHRGRKNVSEHFFEWPGVFVQ